MIMELNGYKCITTFWEDFSIADAFGKAAVLDTYKRAFEGWHENYKYMTELVMVLNHKIWQHYELGHAALASIYDDLWRGLDEWCWANFTKEQQNYYWKITD